MSRDNYPPGMSEADWRYMDGPDLGDDEPHSDCCEADLIGEEGDYTCSYCKKPCESDEREYDPSCDDNYNNDEQE